MPKYVIWTNVSITRRKSFFMVADPSGEIIWRDRHFWPCADFLDNLGVEEYELRPSEQPHLSRLATLRVTKEL
jgi:hypothetical protein